MVGWHHQLNGREFSQALGDGEGQGNLAHSNPWGHKKLDKTEPLSNNNNLAAGCRSFLYSPHWRHYASSEMPTPACWHLLTRGLSLRSAGTSSKLQGHWHLPASASSSGIWVLAPWESLFGAQRFKSPNRFSPSPRSGSYFLRFYHQKTSMFPLCLFSPLNHRLMMLCVKFSLLKIAAVFYVFLLRPWWILIPLAILTHPYTLLGDEAVSPVENHCCNLGTYYVPVCLEIYWFTPVVLT